MSLIQTTTGPGLILAEHLKWRSTFLTQGHLSVSSIVLEHRYDEWMNLSERRGWYTKKCSRGRYWKNSISQTLWVSCKLFLTTMENVDTPCYSFYKQRVTYKKKYETHYIRWSLFMETQVFFYWILTCPTCFACYPPFLGVEKVFNSTSLSSFHAILIELMAW